MNPAVLMNKKPVFFGCPLDVDEREEAIGEKLASSAASGQDDPYVRIMEAIGREIPPELYEAKGSLDVPCWLRPVPPPSERERVTLERIVQFIDGNGCLQYAEQVGDFVGKEILPQIPCLLGVDHSLTGGVFKQLAGFYGPDNISLVILDSHTDALPVSVVAEAVQYDLETNPDSLHDPHDPYLYNRPDSYNASSFLDYLLSEGSVLPHNLYILGIGDFPPKQAFRIKDPRIKRYVGQFSTLKRQGVTLLTKNDLLLSPAKVKSVLKQIRTPWIYLSIDLDIGAGNAVEGVRFLDRQGLNEAQLMRVVGYLRDVLDRGIGLAGFDLTEINPRIAGLQLPGGQDPTYRIAVEVIKKLLWSL